METIGVFSVRSLISLYAVVLICWLLGNICLFNFSNVGKKNPIVFIVGMVVLVTSTAVYFTSGITSLILLVFFLGASLFIGMSKMKIQEVFSFNMENSILLLTPFIIFISNYVQLISLESFPLINTGRDHVFYSTVSYFIAERGQETSMYDWLINPELIGSTPYHYFELWLNSFISRLGGVLHLHAFEFVCIPLLIYSVFILVYTQLRKNVSRNKALFYSLSIVFFINPTFIGLSEPTLILLPKLLLICIVMVIQYWFYTYGNYLSILYLMVTYMLLNLMLLPLSFAGFLILSIFYVFTNKIELKHLLYPSLVMIITIVSLLLFYRLFKGSAELSAGIDLMYLLKYYCTDAEKIFHLKKGLHFFVLYLIKPITGYPLIWIPCILFYFFRKSFNIQLSAAILMLFAFLSLGAAFIHPFTESSQIVTNFLIPFSMLMHMALLTNMLKSSTSNYSHVFIMAIIGILPYSIKVSKSRPMGKVSGLFETTGEQYLNMKDDLIHTNTFMVHRYVDTNDIEYAYDLYNCVQPWGYELYSFNDGWLIYTLNQKTIDYSKIIGVPSHLLYNITNSNWYYNAALSEKVKNDKISTKQHWVLNRAQGKDFFVLKQ